MRPAERVALLSALADAVSTALTAAKADALALGEQVGVKTFTTPYGQVTLAAKDATPVVTDTKLFEEWVRETYPTEIETTVRVRPSFQTAVMGSVEWDKDLQEFVHPATGTIVPGVKYSAPGTPYVTYPSSADQRRTKEEARQWFTERSEALLSGMTPAVEAVP